MQNPQYERALKLWTTSDTTALLHYCFVVIHDVLKAARSDREIEEAQERMRQCGNAEYERALKVWVSLDVKWLVHYVFSKWHSVWRERLKDQEIEEAQARLEHMQNSQYERTLKLWTTLDTTALLHYCFVVIHDVLKAARSEREIQEAQERMAHMQNSQYERALKLWTTFDTT